jgi:hypothetical protein
VVNCRSNLDIRCTGTRLAATILTVAGIKERCLLGLEPPPKSTRKFPRYSLDVRVSVHAFRAEGPVSMWGRSHEMGKDGIGATLTGELDLGEVVSMEMALPLSSFPIKIRAIVRYRQGLRHGFEFLTLTDGQREAVYRVCEMLAASSQ